MQLSYKSNYDEFIFKVVVATTSPQKIRIVLKDADYKNTVFTDRYHVVNGSYTFYIRVPVSGKNSILDIYNDDIGNILSLSDSTFKLVQAVALPLEKRYDCIDITDRYLNSYIKFCTRFCFNAGHLLSGNYTSNDGIYTIQYLPTIVGDDGIEVNTCARISRDNGLIQVSQKKFVDMTVPMRMAIMLHEFSHFYVNDNMDDEIEADLNAMVIYLCLGYPRIEAMQAFTEAFDNAATEQNVERVQIVSDFLKEFDSASNSTFIRPYKVVDNGQ
jgi:hypothetical protein